MNKKKGTLFAGAVAATVVTLGLVSVASAASSHDSRHTLHLVASGGQHSAQIGGGPPALGAEDAFNEPPKWWIRIKNSLHPYSLPIRDGLDARRKFIASVVLARPRPGLGESVRSARAGFAIQRRDNLVDCGDLPAVDSRAQSLCRVGMRKERNVLRQPA